MKQLILLLCYALLATNMIYASTITFNSSNNTFTENGHNFTVTGDGYVWNADYRSALYCAVNSTSSGSTILTKTSGNSIKFNSLWIKGAWAGFQLVVKGYNDNTQLHTTGTISVSSGYTQTNLSNWTGVNKLIVTAVSNGFFAIDDIDYTIENATPTNIALSNSSIADGSESGTTVGTFSTTDSEDAGGHTYSFASGGTDNSSFTISGTSLLTSFVADAGTKSSYSIKIRSTDTGSLYFEKDFTVTVTPTGAVWTGTTTTFTKANDADFTLEANQDRITSNVWITRKSSQGIYNIKTESGYANSSSPDDTEWATGTTANYLDYTYTDWETWQANETSDNTPDIVGVDAVIHLISENIYIDIKFTSWTSGGAGGGFGYERSTNQAVPVELTCFEATVANGIIVLNWATATEVNNYGFNIERKHKSVESEWEDIAFVEGHGNSNSPKYYEFIDQTAPANELNYRLKQIDNNGDFEYSEVVTISGSLIKTELFQNHPNPFNPSTQISYTIEKAGMVNLSVYNALGQKVAELVNSNMIEGIHNVEFNASNLASGFYFYRLETDDFTQTKKMMLLK